MRQSAANRELLVAEFGKTAKAERLMRRVLRALWRLMHSEVRALQIGTQSVCDGNVNRVSGDQTNQINHG
ncbi:hypothetical protein Q8A67_012358 [Cirrhinus molitorella]|uniref:Uncharacterized protein n=1 Tax=Cirrhinus molitorella TaxID=172907 RepID=A0AA88PJI0_9TELE|nr:hypothetical protein Q8A67_012358 [Cirrhinus molitorella]